MRGSLAIAKQFALDWGTNLDVGNAIDVKFPQLMQFDSILSCD